MSGFNYVFDATQYTPEQSAGAHPVGKFPAFVSNTEIKPTRDGGGGMFVVDFSTEQGKISMRYNLWNQNQKAVDIAHKQLCALSHATGVFRIDMSNEGAALRNARCMIEVGVQKGEENYVEIKKVFDVNGNEPGKAPAPAPAPSVAPQNAQPFAAPQAAPANAWGGAPATNAFGQAPSAAPEAPPASAPAWSQGTAAAPAANGAPPWGQR